MKSYTKPSISVTRFATEDVIMVSGAVAYTTAASQAQYLQDNGLVLESSVGGDGAVISGAYFNE